MFVQDIHLTRLCATRDAPRACDIVAVLEETVMKKKRDVSRMSRGRVPWSDDIMAPSPRRAAFTSLVVTIFASMVDAVLAQFEDFVCDDNVSCRERARRLHD